jgi:hypothetical protein
MTSLFREWISLTSDPASMCLLLSILSTQIDTYMFQFSNRQGIDNIYLNYPAKDPAQ